MDSIQVLPQDLRKAAVALLLRLVPHAAVCGFAPSPV